MSSRRGGAALSPRLSAFRRGLAVRGLTRVLSEQRPLDESLQELFSETDLDVEDRAWLQEVCSGTLRWKGRLDSLIDSVALRKKPTGWLRKMLLIAAYQLVVQDRVQPAAVVYETVAEVRDKEGEAPARFANAVLRRVSEHSREYRVMELDPASSLEEAAAWGSLPAWLWRRVVRQHGIEWGVRYAKSCLERPVLWVRSRDARLDWAAEPGPVPGSFRVTQPGMIAEKPGFHEGHFFVQDISSQFLVEAISGEVRRSRSEGGGSGALLALDLCAAPGGKTAGLAWNGFLVTSTDRAEMGQRRFSLLKQTVERVAKGMARVISREEAAMLPLQDLVWVDAPCTGTGIIRRHPDVRWLRREGELNDLRSVQEALVIEAWSKVRPGGFLAYSVCSVLSEEGPDLLEMAFKRIFEGKGVRMDELLTRSWFLTPMDSPYGDGFWAALVRKPVF